MVYVALHCRLSGISPFWGGDDRATSSNVIEARWQFEKEAFNEISDIAKDFISHILVKVQRYKNSLL